MNPLLSDWTTPFELPPFDAIDESHYAPAIDAAIAAYRTEVEQIRQDQVPPTFGNTVVALERAGALLDRVIGVFANVTNTDTTDGLQALEAEVYPRLSQESDWVYLDATLFDRVRQVYAQRHALGLDEQDARLLELTHRDFVRAGAALDPDKKARLRSINTKLAELTTRFSQNLLAETKAFELRVTDESRLAGVPADLVRAAAARSGEAGVWAFGLDRPVFEGFMTFAADRDLRRQLFDGYRNQGANGGGSDNRALILEIVQLRAERAALLGYRTHADYQLEPTMAGSSDNAHALLLEVWPRALVRLEEERAEMSRIAGFDIEGHDWWYYAEKLRQERYAFDESEVKPYFEVENVRRGAFDVAGRLFGVRFEPLDDLPAWNRIVRSYGVTTDAGDHLGVFMADDLARDSKRGGAWMSTYRSANETTRPIVTNNLNLTPPADGDPALMDFDSVETLFHEFGHGLHGLLTQARYERYSGTSGSPRDYVEFPSQFMEHYASEPEVLSNYARHVETGEPIPSVLIEKIREARTHNQGFKTTEYTAAALLDLAWHTLTAEEAAALTDVRAFERSVLERYGLPAIVEPRYRSPYFSHLFSSPSGYSAGYYAYLWSEVLDADGFQAFVDAGDPFDPALASRLKENVYEAGYVAPGAELYRRFRGADPSVSALLAARGL
ncbi:MAG: M3 family metallopeptidase [Bacteroidota bacterium]